MDDATNEIYSAFFVAEEGTMSSFRRLCTQVIGRAKGLFCSLYADRAGTLLAHARGRRQGGQGQSDPGGPGAWQQLGIELIPAYSPAGAGRSERMFGTLQKRLPQELRTGRHHHHGGGQPVS